MNLRVRTGLVVPSRVEHSHVYPAIERYVDDPAWPRWVLWGIGLAGLAAMAWGW